MFSDFIILHLVAIRKGIIVVLGTCVFDLFIYTQKNHVNIYAKLKSFLEAKYSSWTGSFWNCFEKIYLTEISFLQNLL